MEDFIYIGRVANTHGVQGMLKVFPTTEDPKRFELLKEVYIEDVRGVTNSYTIKNVKYFKNMIILSLKEIVDMNQAEKLKNGIVKIYKKDALPLDENEYYISDLLGIEVYDEENIKIGTLKNIIFTGSNDVYEIDDLSKNGLLLPAIKECILNIDVINKRITVKIPKGL